MMMLRNKPIQRWMALFTGIAFLNMSFFLAEVSALKLDKNQKMLENIAKLIAGAASEEEKDIFGSASEEDNLTQSELDLFLSSTKTTENFLIPVSIHVRAHGNEKPILQFSEITYPPPKL